MLQPIKPLVYYGDKVSKAFESVLEFYRRRKNWSVAHKKPPRRNEAECIETVLCTLTQPQSPGNHTLSSHELRSIEIHNNSKRFFFSALAHWWVGNWIEWWNRMHMKRFDHLAGMYFKRFHCDREFSHATIMCMSWTWFQYSQLLYGNCADFIQCKASVKCKKERERGEYETRKKACHGQKKNWDTRMLYIASHIIIECDAQLFFSHKCKLWFWICRFSLCFYFRLKIKKCSPYTLIHNTFAPAPDQLCIFFFFFGFHDKVYIFLLGKRQWFHFITTLRWTLE